MAPVFTHMNCFRLGTEGRYSITNFNLSHLRQVYSVVSKQEEQAHSSFPAIFFRMKSFAHMPSDSYVDLYMRRTKLLGSAHVKFDV